MLTHRPDNRTRGQPDFLNCVHKSLSRLLGRGRLLDICAVKVSVVILTALFAVGAETDNNEGLAAFRIQLINKFIVPGISGDFGCFEVTAGAPAGNVSGLLNKGV